MPILKLQSPAASPHDSTFASTLPTEKPSHQSTTQQPAPPATAPPIPPDQTQSPPQLAASPVQSNGYAHPLAGRTRTSPRDIRLAPHPSLLASVRPPPRTRPKAKCLFLPAPDAPPPPHTTARTPCPNPPAHSRQPPIFFAIHQSHHSVQLPRIPPHPQPHR